MAVRRAAGQRQDPDGARTRSGGPHAASDGRIGTLDSRLRVVLRDLGLRMGVNDTWIAATALALGVPVITQDADYVRVPGLEVVLV